MAKGEPVPPDPSLTLREWLYENAKARRGETAADRQREALSRSIPHMILQEPATSVRCQLAGLILEQMGEQQSKDVKNQRGKTPESLDVQPFEDCESVADLVQQYVSQHAPTSGVRVVQSLEEAIPGAWEEEPVGLERRRWIFTLRLILPPEKLRNQFERARLIKGLPGRN